MLKTVVFLIVVTLASANGSFANTADFEMSRDDLSPESKLILGKVAEQLQPDVDAEQIIKSTVRDLVKAGEIKMGSAREHTLSAVQCLKKLKT